MYLSTDMRAINWVSQDTKETPREEGGWKFPCSGQLYLLDDKSKTIVKMFLESYIGAHSNVKKKV